MMVIVTNIKMYEHVNTCIKDNSNKWFVKSAYKRRKPVTKNMTPAEAVTSWFVSKKIQNPVIDSVNDVTIKNILNVINNFIDVNIDVDDVNGMIVGFVLVCSFPDWLVSVYGDQNEYKLGC